MIAQARFEPRLRVAEAQRGPGRGSSARRPQRDILVCRRPRCVTSPSVATCPSFASPTAADSGLTSGISTAPWTPGESESDRRATGYNADHPHTSHKRGR